MMRFYCYSLINSLGLAMWLDQKLVILALLQLCWLHPIKYMQTLTVSVPETK